MKSIYNFCILLSLFLLAGCSKDFLKPYDDRIVGTWRISDVNRVGIGGNISGLPFTNGRFTFFDNGSLEYVNSANVLYKGNWEIRKRVRENETVRSLQIFAIDFVNQAVLSEYYDDMNFAGTDHFKANIESGLHTYVTHFRR